MAQTAGEAPSKPRIQKCLRDIERLINAQGKGLWGDPAITALERALSEICRIFDKKVCRNSALVVLCIKLKMFAEFSGQIGIPKFWRHEFLI